MSWEHHLPALVARGPKDGLRTISERFFHPCLTLPHPHVAHEAENELAKLTKPSVKRKMLKLSKLVGSNDLIPEGM